MLTLSYIKCGVFALSMFITFACQASVIFKFENGFYAEPATPWPSPQDALHRRARRTFYAAGTLILLLVTLLGYAVHQRWPELWMTYGLPSVLGAFVSVFYTTLTRSDRVRPRSA